ncbi:2-C-methyl-D-erythritol 4-phosphate cytidylyltransferase [Photobacterium kishitanii]|uniref:2-C-methyl-D-erythritol 4-phosphate cytidylyltransferase n=2 Tax=Photobacterium kishitanii TaxID=318456 RepID=A0AAX0YW76_9GAMM|nr:2-C-methyl-D-erythritol 4-phosphate cytidylyltransferase [Photobacterium kishitanii]KJG09146.1 2-C-methyl-D-erythritol 4-phosphate cytidylyltransferase [Photobacterium kishitanii]KJG56353.1 2-C-methyl-D-erythritol 4-phosphate cytidylyltransferase [Photobacterium kishitanii]KJG60217.1 2-C-methyl-D-erythritol 4-phosphate cytidylyltransferase [Photobacterium kishitanii]KJG64470.1 2-C-methyl-D-erythritol 4-phosphate cytidylyltransferase [Photobacterium kishitanii]KJG68653.1 2-C-methyl-D-erythri
MIAKEFIAVVPAAGVGSRMAADRPKQYLHIAGKTILEHTVDRLLSLAEITRVVIAISADDPYFPLLPLATDPRITVVDGGAERADSVFAGLAAIDNDNAWVLVHDAARPCVRQTDLQALITAAVSSEYGAILAAPVRDTMKRGQNTLTQPQISHTVDRENLWHALTPQMFRVGQLRDALTAALAQGATITDEASALEFCGYTPLLVAGRSDNLKVTQPEDLALAEFYLQLLLKEQH